MKTNRIARGQIFMIIVLIFSVLVLAVDSRPAAAYAETDFVIHALSTSSDAIVMDGPINLIVDNGSIYSNGGVIKKGSNGAINLLGGNLLIAMDNGWSGTGVVNPAPIYTGSDGQDLQPILLPEIPEPSCAMVPIETGITGSKTLLPGLHCISGDISLSGSDVLTGNGVMIVMLNGGIKLSGNAQMLLNAGTGILDGNNYVWGGMLIYVPQTNSSAIDLGGHGSFSGTVYATQSTCSLTGPISSIKTNIICNKVKIQSQEEIRLAAY